MYLQTSLRTPDISSDFKLIMPRVVEGQMQMRPRADRLTAPRLSWACESWSKTSSTWSWAVRWVPKNTKIDFQFWRNMESSPLTPWGHCRYWPTVSTKTSICGIDFWVCAYPSSPYFLNGFCPVWQGSVAALAKLVRSVLHMPEYLVPLPGLPRYPSMHRVFGFTHITLFQCYMCTYEYISV